MARFSGIATSLSAGVLSRRLQGRDNIEQYYESARYSDNWLFTVQGTALKRSGTRFLSTELRSWFIPFEPVLGEGYVIAASDLKFRFYVADGRVEPSGILEVVSPFTQTQLPLLQYEQEANVLYLTHPSAGHPYKLRRTGANTFTLARVVWRAGRAPMLPDNLDRTITFTVSGSAPNYTLTASAGFTRGFSSADVGRYVRVSNNTSQRWFEITATTSALVCTVQVRDQETAAPFTAATSDWSLGATSNTVGFRTLALHEGRMMYGGTSENGERMWASNSDDFDFFEPRAADLADLQTEQADRAFTRRTPGRSINDIQWMASVEKRLVIGTTSGEFSLVSTDDSILTPTSARIAPGPRHGSEQVRPALVDGDVIFVQRSGQKMRRGQYTITDDRYSAPDLGTFAEDIPATGVRKLAFQQIPENYLWCVTDEDRLFAITIDKEQRVLQFHPHVLGGSYYDRDPRVLDAEVIRTPEADYLLLHVERTINGSVVRFVERMETPFRPTYRLRRRVPSRTDLVSAVEKSFFVDAGLDLNAPIAVTGVTRANPAVVTAPAHGLTSGDVVRVRDMQFFASIDRRRFEVEVLSANTVRLLGSNTSAEERPYQIGGALYKEVSTIGGLGHLEGETVKVLADGGRHPDRVVTAGQIALQAPASIVAVGLRYAAEVETQRLVGGGRLGSEQGQTSRIHRVGARLIDTLGGVLQTATTPNGREERIQYRTLDDLMGEALPLFSGDVEFGADSEHGKTPTIIFYHDDPLPAHILSLYARMTVNER